MTPDPSSEFLEALLTRDRDAIAASIRTALRRGSPRDAYDAILRFAIAGFTPSLHGAHALIVCAEAGAVLTMLQDPAPLLLQCAAYAADARQPWSEPPLPGPPEDDGPADLDEAVATSDRLAGERWLADAMTKPAFPAIFFDAAKRCAGELGDGLVVALHAFEIAREQDEAYRFPVLRIAVNFWTASLPGTPAPLESRNPNDLWNAIVADIVREEGDVIAFHRAELFDAALRVDALLGGKSPETGVSSPESGGNAPVYEFARDYGAAFIASRIAQRHGAEFPDVDFAALREVQLRHRDGAEYDRFSHA